MCYNNLLASRQPCLINCSSCETLSFLSCVSTMIIVSMCLIFYRCMFSARSICALPPCLRRRVLIFAPALLVPDNWLTVCSPNPTKSHQDLLALCSPLLHLPQQLSPLFRPLVQLHYLQLLLLLLLLLL